MVEIGDTKKVNGHKIEAVEGTFHEVVWRCTRCGDVRSVKNYFNNFDCE